MNLNLEEACERNLSVVNRPGGALAVSTLIFAEGTENLVRRNFLYASHWLAYLDRADLERFVDSRKPGETERVRLLVMNGFSSAGERLDDAGAKARAALLSHPHADIRGVAGLQPTEITVQLRSQYDQALWDLIIKCDQVRTDIARYCGQFKIDPRRRLSLLFVPKKVTMDAVTSSIETVKTLLADAKWSDRPRTATGQLDQRKLNYAQ